MDDVDRPKVNPGAVNSGGRYSGLADSLTGATVSRYVVEARLGAGGMGEVYRAEDPVLRRLVAIKRMLRRDGSEAEQAHFLREGQRASSLHHPNIACIHDVLLEGGEVLLVMEYIAGETLRARMSGARAAPLPLAEFYAIAIQCADALAAAHEHGILHGDIKPENMMVCGGTLKLLDFGVARRLPSGDAPTETSLTLVGALAGTPRYMAPEMFTGQPADERADIFALGVVMYEMLSGRHPFAGATGAASIGQVLHGRPALLTGAGRIHGGSGNAVGGAGEGSGSGVGRASSQLGALVEKALAKDPAQRYGSARQLAEDLRTLQAGRTVAGLGGKTGRRRVLWFAGGAGLVAVIVGLGVALTVGRHALIGSGRAGDGTGPGVGSGALLSPHRNLAILAPSVAGTDPRLEAFGRGLAESVAAKLSELGANHDLAVVPPDELGSKGATTLERARQEFGSTLGLAVSLQSLNDQTRTAYSLIDAASGHILAGSNITANSTDLFRLEDEVASGVARALQLTLAPEETRALAANATTKPEAYRYFLEGIGYLHESIGLEETSKAEGLFKEALKIDPEYGAARAGLGEAYWDRYKATRQTRWIGESRKDCQAAIALGNAGAQGHICLGTLDDGTGAYAEAVQEFQEAEQLEPANDAAYLGLAKAYEKLGEAGKAEQTYQNAIRLRPQYWRSYNSLGAFYIDQAEYEKAANMFTHAEALAPDNYHVPNNLGASLLYLGRGQEAVRAFERSIAIRPTYFAYQNIGVAYYRLRRFTDAVGSYRKALQLDGNDYASWGGMGDSLYYGGNQSAALPYYLKAIVLAEAQLKVNPNDAEVVGDLASYHSMVGHNQEALALLAESLHLGHTDKELLFNAAMVYNQLHEEGLALQWLERALEAGYSRPVVAGAVAFDNLRSDPRYIRLMRQSESRDRK